MPLDPADALHDAMHCIRSFQQNRMMKDEHVCIRAARLGQIARAAKSARGAAQVKSPKADIEFDSLRFACLDKSFPRKTGEGR